MGLDRRSRSSTNASSQDSTRWKSIPKINKTLLFILKASVSIVLIAVLVHKVDWGKIRLQVGQIDVLWLSSVIVIKTLLFPVSVLKWQRCLLIHDITFRFGYLLKVICIGFFFNNFLPSTIGGDGYRLLKTIPRQGYRSRAISALLLERIVGFAALMLLGVVCALLFQASNSAVVIRTFNLFGLVGIALLGGMLLLRGVLGSLLEKLKRRLAQLPKFDPLFVNATYIRRNPRELGNIALISVGFHFLAFFSVLFLFEALAVESTLADAAIIVALTAFFALIPLSINGIGIMEGAFVLVAVQLGLPLDESTVVVFTHRFLTIVFSIICGLVYLYEQIKTKGGVRK